jgi:glycogen operon protein
MLEKNRDMYEFFRFMIKFRHNHKTLRRKQEPCTWGFPDISFHSEQPWKADYHGESRAVGVLFAGNVRTSGKDEAVYLAMNMWWEPLDFTLPLLPVGHVWKMCVNTGDETYIHEEPVTVGNQIRMQPRSVAVFVAE